MTASAPDQVEVHLSHRETTSQKLLDEQKHEELSRIARLVEHVFSVPVAFVALTGPDGEVSTKVGTGNEHWKDISPSANGSVSGDLRFVTSAPLRSSTDRDLGTLFIADVRERPDFSPDDHKTFLELAHLLARSVESRMAVSQACQAEHRLRNIADSAPLLFIHTDADGTTSFVNQAWREFTGRTMEEELEHTAITVHPDYRKPVLDSYREALQNHQPATAEFPMRRHDGVYRWMRAQGVPQFRDDGAFLGYIGCFVDITDQRSTMLALRKQALCTAAVAEAAGAFFLILDAEGRVEQVSPLCQRTSGRDTSEMCGRFIWKVCDAAVSGGAAIREAVRQASSTRQPVQASTTCPLPNGKGSGQLDWTLTPVISQNNDVLAVAAVTFGLCAGPGCACSRV